MKKILILTGFFLLLVGSKLFGQATQINAYEYWFNENHAGAVLVNITPVADFTLNTEIPTNTLPIGLHTFHVRFRDSNNNWSSVTSQLFFKTTTTGTPNPRIIAYEYWFDENYTARTSTNVAPTEAFTLNTTLTDLSPLSPGLHTLHIRFKDENAAWSSVVSHFFVNLGYTATPNLITAYRYWFDMDLSTLVTVNLPTPENPKHLITEIDASALDTSILHTVNFQFKDLNQAWSSVVTDTFEVEYSISTLEIVSSDIPPWQREGDEFDGYVTVSTQNPAGGSWHLEVVVTDNTNTPIDTIIYPSITSPTQYFFSSDFQLHTHSKEGMQFEFFAILDINGENIQVGTMNIIERKWWYKNIYYHNNGIDSIKIPMKYYSDYSPTHIEFERTDKVAFRISLDPFFPSILTNNIFTIESNGYYYLSPANTNLEDVHPGNFKIIIYSNQIKIDTMYFCLTKYGELINSENISEKVIVFIGGLFNEIEKNIHELRDNYLNSSLPNSELSFSLMAFLESHDYDTWYIAQSNANSIERNAYDIGKSLQLIKNNNPNISEINIISHSKGGLDVRGFLQGYSKSYDTNSYFDINSDPELKSLLKKVIFLGTPHLGSSLAKQGLKLPYINRIPAIKDLKPNSTALRTLNSSGIPNAIAYVNLSGYTYFRGSIKDGRLYHNSATDGIVHLSSSEGFNTLYGDNGIVWQLYQHSSNDNNHFILHTNSYLSQPSMLPFSKVNCLELSYNNNIDKILAYLSASSNSTIPFETCPSPPRLSLNNSLTGSILPGAKLSVKIQGSTSFYKMGISDEVGNFNATIIPPLEIGDCIKIEAPGYETLEVTIDEELYLTEKLPIAMLKSDVLTNRVKKPSASLSSQNAVTSNSQIELSISSINATHYEVNNPINQDTSFVNTGLGESGGVYTIQLDTGYNSIIIRFIGLIDTAYITKEIYYIPDTFLLEDTYMINVISDSMCLGSNIFINNQFARKINSTIESFRVLSDINTISFSKFGYKDSTIIIDTTITINLALQLQPINYSSITDSNIVNFTNMNRLNYSQNITMLDSTQSSIISLKQYDDDFSSLGLIPKSRKFEFRHLNHPNWSNIKVAMILDQIEDLSLDSIYLMRILDDTSFTKIEFDSVGLVAGYDSIVQKLSFNYINFNNGTALKDALVIMKKQAPVAPNISTLNMNENGSIAIPLSQLFSDPDSLRGDMLYSIPNLSPTGLQITLQDGELIVSAIPCFSGVTSFVIEAIHDGLKTSNTIHINVIKVPLPENIVTPGAIAECYPSVETAEAASLMATTVTDDFIYAFNTTASTIGTCTATITVTATDICGNSDSTSYFTSIDNMAPVATCKNTTVMLNGIGEYMLSIDDVLSLNATNDNCDNYAVAISPSTFNCADINQTLNVQVSVSDSCGNTSTCASLVTVVEGEALPMGWNASNIGSTAGGSSTHAPCFGNGTFVLRAKGYTTNTSDAQHSVFQNLCNNSEIIAHVAGLAPGAGWAGIQMRESNSQGSKKFTLKTQLSTILRRESRTSDFGVTNTLQLVVPSTHTWLKLTRVGNTFTAYSSPDGSNWAFRSSSYIAMGTCIQVGMFVESYNNSTLTTATFDNVTTSGNLQPLTDPAGEDNSFMIQHQVRIYPNPTTGELMIDFQTLEGKMVLIQVYNTQGQIMKNLSVNEVQAIEQIDLSPFVEGIYWIRIQSLGIAPFIEKVFKSGGVIRK